MIIHLNNKIPIPAELENLQIKSNLTFFRAGIQTIEVKGDYFYDIIESAIKEYNPNLIIFSRNDILFSKDILTKISDYIKNNSAVFGFTREFYQLNNLLDDKEIKNGKVNQLNCNFFCFKAEWWNENKHNYPNNLYINAELWNSILVDLIKLTNPAPFIDNICYSIRLPDSQNREKQLENLRNNSEIYHKYRILSLLNDISQAPNVNFNDELKYNIDYFVRNGKNLIYNSLKLENRDGFSLADE